MEKVDLHLKYGRKRNREAKNRYGNGPHNGETNTCHRGHVLSLPC